jgi:hypothetical protein
MNTIGKLSASLMLVTAFLIFPLLIITKPALSKNQIPHSTVVASYFKGKNIVLTTRVKKLPTVSENISSSTVVYRSYTYIAPAVVSTNNNSYQSIINAASAKYGVSAALMNSIIACESGYNPYAQNPSGASGIAQFMPSTFYGSWNIYSSGGIWNAQAQIYAMALKISEGGLDAWTCR